MAEFREDVTIYPILVSLLACLESELTESGLDIPEIFGVEPGQLPAFDLGSDDNECGQGWVILQSAFPSLNFPNQDVATLGLSSPLSFGIQMGIMRCIPGLDENNETPTADQRLMATRDQLADMAAMRRAICKCLKEAKRDFVLGNYQPIGPDGGQVGGTWSVNVRWAPRG
jgi:hypothetical protein